MKQDFEGMALDIAGLLRDGQVYIEVEEASCRRFPAEALHAVAALA